MEVKCFLFTQYIHSKRGPNDRYLKDESLSMGGLTFCVYMVLVSYVYRINDDILFLVYACYGLLCGLTLKAEIMLLYYVMLAFAVTEKSFNVYRSQLCVHLDHIEPCLWMLEHEQRMEQQHFNLLDEIII